MKLPPWAFVIILMSSIGALLFQCVAPLPAAAAIAALTMNKRDALLTSFFAWASTQALGFAFMHYPVDVHSIGWGLAIGGATMLAAQTAIFLQGHKATAITSFLPAFFAYEGSLFALSLMTDGKATFAPTIVMAFLTLNGIWIMAFAGLYLMGRWQMPKAFAYRY